MPLSEYAERPKDRDILVRIIVPKKNAKFNYQSVRISQTDIPVLTCASVKDENGYRFAIGARPARAQIYAQPVDKTAEQMAEAVREEIKTGSSLRGSAEYRRHLAGVLVRRAARARCRVRGTDMLITMTLNGKKVADDVAADTLLIDFVRNHGCLSVKRGCETANCGLCTVFMDESRCCPARCWQRVQADIRSRP